MIRTGLVALAMVALATVALAMIAPGEAEACDSATAVRMVVIGTVGDEVIALELEQRRDGNMSGRTWFYMTASTVMLSFDSDGTMSRRVLDLSKQVRVEDSAASAWVQATFDDHLAAANKKKNFVAAKLVKRVDCDFLNQCDDAKLTGVGLKRGKSVTVKIATPDAFAKDSGAIDNFDGWGIDFLETVKIGKRSFLTVSLGVGFDMDPCEHAAGACVDNRKAKTHKLKAARTTLAHKRGLHHGQEFDVVIPL